MEAPKFVMLPLMAEAVTEVRRVEVKECQGIGLAPQTKHALGWTIVTYWLTTP